MIKLFTNGGFRRMERESSQGGFTIIEIILAIVAAGIIGVITVTYLTQLIATNQLASAQVAVVDEANLALEFLTRELRSVDELTAPVQCDSPAVPCVLSTSYPAITFTKRLEVPIDPLRRDTNNYNIQYAFNGGSNTLERTSGGITTTVATGVTSFTVEEIAANFYRFQLSLTGANGANFTATSAIRIRDTMPQLNVAFVVDNPASLDAGMETSLRDHMQNVLGHIVTLFDDDDLSWTPTNFDMVVLSGNGGVIDDAWLADKAVPILTVDAQNFDEFLLGTGQSRNGGGTDATIVVSHTITEIFAVSTSLTFDSGGQQGFITGFANDVEMLAEYNTSSGRAKIRVVEAGGLLADGATNAADKRAFFGAREFGILNNDGVALFNRTLAWVAQ